METQKKGSAGGKARAISSRKEAIARYMKNPKRCKTCNRIIRVREGQKVVAVRLKEYCNQSCAAVNSNKVSQKRVAVSSGPCEKCGKKIHYKIRGGGGHSKRRFCDVCLRDSLVKSAFGYNSQIFIGDLTKRELRDRRSSWQGFRSAIQAMARKIFKASGKPEMCHICDYGYHYEVAHKKPVSDFGMEAKISEINAVENLVPLCPNHHWEFDHGKLFIK